MNRRFGVVAVTLISLVGSLAGVGCKSERPAPKAPPPVTSAEGSNAAAADDPWTKQAAKAPKDPLARPFLWSAEKDGKTTYLMGTMHRGIDAGTRLPQIVWDKLDAAPTFAMESDISDPELVKVMMRATGSLRDELGPAYWAKLEAAIGPEQAAAIDRLKPMGAASLLALQHLPATSPMDGDLLGRALNQKKKIVYLEEAREVAGVLEKHLGMKTLKMMLDTHEEGADQAAKMLEAYVAGDGDAILAITDGQGKEALKHGFTEAEYREQMQDILYGRNAAWIPAIEELHAGGGGFVAVGALHLVGDKSVLTLLEQRGFKTARIAP